jgi:hypothetical protein
LRGCSAELRPAQRTEEKAEVIPLQRAPRRWPAALAVMPRDEPVQRMAVIADRVLRGPALVAQMREKGVNLLVRITGGEILGHGARLMEAGWIPSPVPSGLKREITACTAGAGFYIPRSF